MNNLRLGFILLLVFSGMMLSSCSSSRDNSLLGDMNSSARCPTTGCADAAPSSEKVYLQRDNSNSIFLGALDSSLEISGSCSSSTFPDNRIEVTSGGNSVSFYAINLGTSALVPKCSMGRFYIFVDACKFNSLSGYSLQVSLKPLDQTQQVVDADASFTVNFSRIAALDPNVCR